MVFFAVSITAAAFFGCNGSNSGSSEGKEIFDKDTSYAIGLFYGSSLRSSMEMDNVSPNVNEIINGMRDGLNDKNMRFTLEEAEILIQTAFNSLQEKGKAEAREKEIAYLKENAGKPGVIMTSSGLQYEIITEKTGPKPTLEDTILVHYEGKFTDGKFFVSSYTYGVPETFGFNEMPPGWDEGLQLMSAGSKYKFVIPSELAYGEEGLVNYMTGEQIIPPFSTLVFEVELLEINPDTGE